MYRREGRFALWYTWALPSHLDVAKRHRCIASPTPCGTAPYNYYDNGNLVRKWRAFDRRLPVRTEECLSIPGPRL